MRVFIAGDSTASIKEDNKRPETGWGEKLGEFLSTDVTILNYAMNGRSTKSFIEGGNFSKMEQEFKQGDILIIQFGHNDDKPNDVNRYTDPFTTYQDNLNYFITKALNKGVTPIILSSIPRRRFLAKNRSFRNTVSLYPTMARVFAFYHNILFIDTYNDVRKFYNYLGEELSKKMFLQLEPNIHPNYPNGVIDNTHLNNEGAYIIAGLIARKLARLNNPLKDYVIPAKIPTNINFKRRLKNN